MSASRIRNMEEFAVVSGISRPTLSKYFNDPESVRASTRARIEAALQTHDFRPNMFAVNQNRRMTRNIGIVVPYLADPFFAEIARQMETMVIGAGFRPILLSSHGDPSQEIDNLESLRTIKPAGVLMAPLGPASDHEQIEAFGKAVPTVHFDSNITGLGDIFVGHNNLQATDIIVKYLVESGEPPVFFEMNTPTNPNADHRRAAYIKGMQDRGLTPEFIAVEGTDWNFEEIGYRGGLKAIMGRKLASNTVLCSNDRLAIGFLAAAFELGLRVGNGPGHAIRVAGHDDHPFSRFTCPPLTTITQDYAGIARRAFECLFTLINQENRSNGARVEVLLDGWLIRRASA
jgi:DNA-binding LacI/PurR family transcriptional regulator